MDRIRIPGQPLADRMLELEVRVVLSVEAFPVQRRKRPRTGQWGQKPVWIEPVEQKAAYRVRVPNVRSWAVGVTEPLADLIQVHSLPQIEIDPKQTPPDVSVKPVVGGQPEEVMTLDQFRVDWPVLRTALTPTPACTGEIDRERRPRCSIVDRKAGAAWRRDPCRSPSLSSSSRSGVPPAAVHHDGLMAAGSILADGIGMSPGARERVRRFGPAPRSVRSSARCSPTRRLIPSCAIGSLVALVVGLLDRLGTSRLRACWGDRHRGADRKTTWTGWR